MPSITGVVPQAFGDGTQVTVSGSGFGTSGTVTIGGVTQNVVSWNDTAVVFTAVRGNQSMGPALLDVVGSGGGLSGGTAALGWSAQSLSDGQTLTITTDGTYNFGAAPSAWLFDTVDNQSAYSALSDGAVVPITGAAPYRTNVGNHMLLGSAGSRRSGGRHYIMQDQSPSFNTSQLGDAAALGGGSPSQTQMELFGRYWIYPSATVSGQSIKLFRVWDDGNGYGTRLSWTIMHFTDSNGTVLNWASTNLTAGSWHLLEMHTKGTRGVADGTAKCYLNGSLIHNVSGITFPAVDTNAGNPITTGLHFYAGPSWDAGSTYSPNQVAKFTDAWFATTPQRVVISSSATWAGRGSAQEVQDIVSWSGTTVTARIFKGQFSSISGKYLYIVGADGNPVNANGVAMVGGGGLSGGTAALNWSAAALADGEPLTITTDGTYSFGSKSQAAPVFWENFESMTVGQTLQSQNAAWIEYNSQGGALVSSADKHSGTRCARNDTSRSGFATNYRTFTQTDTVFLTYWAKMANATPGDDYAVCKLGRINSTEAAGGGGPYNGAGVHALGTWNPYNVPAEAAQTFDNGVQASPANGHYILTPINQWIRIEQWASLGTPGVANGQAHCVVVGHDSDIQNNVINRATGLSFQLNSTILGLMFANATGSGFEMYVDDVYVDYTRQRVEIGNASTWAACTHREIQIPTAWTNTSVTCTLTIGSLTGFSGKYLYVIGLDGNPVSTNGVAL